MNRPIIQSPYNDEWCSNCRYHITKIEGQENKYCCEIHKVEISEWEWCEGWESDEGCRIYIKGRD